MEDSDQIERKILNGLRDRVEKCMSFDEIIDEIGNPERVAAQEIPTIAFTLNNLVKRQVLRQFRAIYYGRIQNHYMLVE